MGGKGGREGREGGGENKEEMKAEEKAWTKEGNAN